MSFFGFKNDDHVDVFCMNNNNNNNNQEDDLAMFELGGGGGGGGNNVGVEVVDNNFGRIDSNKNKNNNKDKNNNKNKNHDNIVITAEDDLAMFELAGDNMCKKKEKETTKSSSSSYYDGLFVGGGSLLEPINIDDDDDDNKKFAAGRKKLTPRRRPVPVPVINIDDDDDVATMANVKIVNRKRNRLTTLQGGNKKVKTGKYSIVKEKPNCFDVKRTTNNNNNKKGNGNGNDIGGQKQNNGNDTSSRNLVTIPRKEKKKDNKPNDDLKDAVKGQGGNNDVSSSNDNINNIEKKGKRNRRKENKEKKQRDKLKKMKEGNNSSTNTNHPTNQDVLVSQDADRMTNKDRPMSNGKTISPKSVLCHYYEKKPDNVQVTANNYITWYRYTKNGKTWDKISKNSKKPKRQFTSIFVCPITKEAFLAGPWDGGGKGSSKQRCRPGRICWYSCNILAEHAAAARAWDCLLLREGGNLRDFRLGGLEPYWPMQQPLWRYIEVPSSVQQRLPHEYQRFVHSEEKCTTKKTDLRNNEDPGSVRIESSTSHNATNSAGNILNVSNSNAIIIDTKKKIIDRTRLPNDIADPTSDCDDDADADDVIVLSINEASHENVRRQTEDLKSNLIRTKQAATAQIIAQQISIDELAQPKKKSFQQKERLPTIINQKNDGTTTTISSTNANTIQNKLNSIDRGRDQFFQQQQQQQQNDEFDRCQRQLWECVPEKIQTTTENILSKEKGNKVVGKLPVEMSLSVIEACTEKEKSQIHRINKDIICSDEKTIKMEGGATSCVQESFKNENSDDDVPLIMLRTKKGKRKREKKPQVIKIKEEADSKEDAPLIAPKKRSETTTHNSQPQVIKIKEEADSKEDAPLIALKKKSETTTHNSQPQVIKIKEEAESEEDIPIIALKKKSETTTHNSQPQVIKIKQEADSKEDVSLVALKKKSETTTYNSLPPAYANNPQSIQIISTSQKQSSNSSTNGIASDPIEEDTITRINFQNRSQKLNGTENQLYERQDTDKTKDINKSNDTVDTVTLFAIKDAHMKASVEKESCSLGVRRNEAKISSFLEHVYGYLPNTHKNHQIEKIDADAVECLKPKEEDENTLDAGFFSTGKETKEATETNMRTNLTKKVVLDPKTDYNPAASKSVEPIANAEYPTSPEKSLPTKPRFKPQKNKRTNEKVSIDLMDEGRLPKNDHPDKFDSVETKATTTAIPHNLNPVQLRILLAASSSNNRKKKRRTSDKKQKATTKNTTTNTTTTASTMTTTTMTNITEAVKLKVDPSLKRKGNDDEFAVATVTAAKRRVAARSSSSNGCRDDGDVVLVASKSVEPIEIAEDPTSPEKQLPTLEEGGYSKARNSDSHGPKTDCNLAASKSVEPIEIAEDPTPSEKSLPTKPRFKPQKNKRTKKVEKVSIDLKQNECTKDSSRAPHSHNCLSPTDEGRLPKNDHPNKFGSVLNKKGVEPEKLPTNLNSTKYSPPPPPERRFVFHPSNGKSKPEPRRSSKPVHVDVFNGMALKDALIEQERLLRSAAARVRTKAAFRVTTEYMINPIRSKTFTVLVRDIHLQYSDHWEYTNYYSRLGLPSNANVSVVKAAYRRLCLVYHPDRNIGKADTKRKFQAVTEAYHSLMNAQSQR
jgi:hypothetical protein